MLLQVQQVARKPKAMRSVRASPSMNSGRTSAAEIRARPGCLHKCGFGEVWTHTRRSGAGDIYQNCMLGSIRPYGPMQEAWCGAVGGGGGNVVKFSLPCGAWSSSWRVYLGGLSSALAGIQGRAEKLKRFCFLIPDRLVTSASIFAVSIRMNASHESSNLLSLALCRSCPPPPPRLVVALLGVPWVVGIHTFPRVPPEGTVQPARSLLPRRGPSTPSLLGTCKEGRSRATSYRRRGR